MKTGQHGIIAPIWLYAAAAIALMVALAGLIKVWNNYTTALDKKGYDRGVAETTAAYTKRDNSQLQAALAAQTVAEGVAATAERKAATAQSDASKAYNKGVNDGKAKTAQLVAAAKSGALRLRDPGNQAGTSTACNNQVSQSSVAGPAAGSDAGTGTLISAAASDFLLQLTGEADDTALQLAACQVILVSDRVLCNAP